MAIIHPCAAIVVYGFVHHFNFLLVYQVSPKLMRLCEAIVFHRTDIAPDCEAIV